MADLIERDAAISKFIEGDGDDEFTNGYNFAVDEYRKEISDIPAVNRWIPVEDALPEQSGFYLAYFTFKDGTHATDIAYINTGCHLGSITHWMPLPEPPESEVHGDAYTRARDDDYNEF